MLKGAKAMKIKKKRKKMVLVIDFFILIMVSLVVCFMFTNKDNGSYQYNSILILNVLLLFVTNVASQLLYKTYDSLWRYAQSKEYLMLLLGGITGYLLYLVIIAMMPLNSIPTLYTLCVASLSIIGMLFMRLSYRQYRKHYRYKIISNQIPIAIIGAGEAGVNLLEELQSNPSSRYCPVCLIDDSVEKIGQRIHNIIILGPIQNLEKYLIDRSIRDVIIAIPSITADKQRRILEMCAKVKCRVRILPDNLAFMQNQEDKSLWSSVRDIQIGELLGREMITLDTNDIKNFLFDKVVLVTGGGGSIGSELCRQIAKASPKKLIIVDNYENSTYDIQQELFFIYKKEMDLKVEIASVRDKDKLDMIFQKHRPNIVFHAAAYKHVPLMEDCPEEAINNNIFGTCNVVMASDRYEVERFVLISSDKAVNPTSVMGASKRFCEMVIQSMKGNSQTDYVAVRFGNVLGSNGSVIPLFQKQIDMGGPLTITDKNIVRYFMTIGEAVQLVLQAGSMANSSEIYVLDMGEPIKILDLAENLIRLSGHIPYKDIDIIETGLRPGEKLYEEILINSDELISTDNQKIYIELQESISRQEISQMLEVLTEALETRSMSDIKKAMKQVVTTYKDPEEVNAIY